MAFIEAHKEVFTQSNILGEWRGTGLLPFDAEKVLQHIEIPPRPAEEALNSTSLLTQPTNDTSVLDPNLFKGFLHLYPRTLLYLQKYHTSFRNCKYT